jgi:hypothetical protein
MLKQTITWTALPNGVDGAPVAGSTVRVSAFVAPRLWNDQSASTMKLSQFPDFLDWPAVVRGATFKVTFAGGPTLDATVTSAAPESDLWGELFKSDTDVVPFEFEDLSGAQIQTFSAGDAHEAIIDTYQNAATNPDYHGGNRMPDTDDLVEDPGLVDFARPVRPEPPYDPGDMGRHPVPEIPPSGPTPSGGLGCLVWPFAFLIALVRRILKWLGFPVVLALLPLLALIGMPLRFGAGGGGGGGRGGGGSPRGPPSARRQALDDIRAYLEPTSEHSEDLEQIDLSKIFDFHRMVASLGDYPVLLRRMGLVIDLAVTVPAGGLPGTGTARIAPTVSLSTTTTGHEPVTHYELAEGLFVARPREPGKDLANGLFRLQDSTRFEVHQVDVVGSAVKLQNTATNLVGQRTLGTEPVNSPDQQGLPALQTAGISVVRPNVRSRLQEIFRRMYALNRQLAAAEGRPDMPIASGEPSPDRTNEVFAEDLTRGYRIDIRDAAAPGWLSLCRRVGTYAFLDSARTETIEDEGFVQIGTTEAVRRPVQRVLRAHETVFAWDGWSLVAPRPGEAILPDAAPRKEDTAPHPSDHGVVPNTAVTQFRLETTFRAKEATLPRLRYGHRYRVRARMVDLAGNSVFEPEHPAFDADQPEVSAEFTFRRFEPVGPPPVMLRDVPKEGESLETLTVRSAVDDPEPQVRGRATERHLAPPKGAQLLAERHGHFDTPAAMLSNPAGYELAAREAGSLTHRVDPATGDLVQISGVEKDEFADLNRTYWRQANATFAVSYLPDPYARGVLLRNLPGMASVDAVQDGVNRLPFDGTWPDLKPIRLRLTGLPAGDASAPPAWDAANRLLTVGLAQGASREVLIASYFHKADLETMGVWDWTVQAAPPNLADLETAAVEGRNWLHLPYRTLTLIHAVQQPLAVATVGQFDPPQRDPGDTAAILNGTLKVDAKSTGKVDVWADWTDPVDNPEKSDLEEVENRVHVRDLILPDAANDAPTLLDAVVGMWDPQRGLAPTGLQHTIGDTKRHDVEYTLVATTRFREHFPTAIVDDPKNLVRPRQSDPELPKALTIPSSARPAPPRVPSMLPIFKWTDTQAGDVRRRERRGGGLRVYLERPWFSSGIGELLGVVLRPPGFALMGKEAETLRKYTSEWGMDPLWHSAEMAPAVEADFANPVASMPGLRLLELDSPDVGVVGFKPVFDKEGRRWFADIEMHTGQAYFPFVRLAVARFQPESIARVHLSSVVLTDFIQVVPERTATYDLTNLGAGGRIDMTLEGPGHAAGDWARNGRTIVVARLEAREHGDTSTTEPLGWTPIESVLLERTQGPGNTVRWTGSLILATAPPKPLRVSILEAQLLRADGGRVPEFIRQLTTAGEEGGAAFGMHIASIAGPGETFGARVVFADATVVSP